MNRSQRLPLLVSLLLVLSAALFAVGTAIEHSQRAHHDVHVVASAATKSGETSAEKTANGESSGSGKSTTKAGETKPAEPATPTTASGETHSEKIAGVDPESWPLVGLAIAVSLLIAVGVYWRRGRWLTAAVAFAILFAAGDIRELVRQIQEARTTVATIAGILIALHLLIAAAAASAIRQRGAWAMRESS